LPSDVAIFIDFVAAGGDDLRVERHIAVGQSDAIEHQLHVALAPEMAGILGRFEMPDKIGSARKRLPSEFRHRVQMAEHGIADGNGGGRKVRFIHGALQKGTGGQDGLPRTGTREAQNGQA
jgi:hypothetical protein